MYSAARVNQFEMKDTCIKFVIAVLIFCEINDNTSGFFLVLLEAYS